MEGETQILIQEKEGNNNNHAIREEHFHVLAVDDSVIDRKMLEKLLTISSCHVTCVESGDKALEYLGLMNCHVGDHHHDDHASADDDGDDSDEHDDGDAMIFPHHSLPLVNAHSQQEWDHVAKKMGLREYIACTKLGQGARVNLIMTDYSMPGVTGYDLLKKVKESSWKDVPVVVMSSENVPSRIHMCLEEGAEEFLLKPVRLSDLKKLQPRILKSTTPGTSAKMMSNNILATNEDNGIKISKEIITAIGDDHNEEYISISKEVNEKNELLKNESENFAKISKLEQL